MKFQRLAKSINTVLFILWLSAAAILFLSGETIFILPAFFIGYALATIITFSINHIPISGRYFYLVWSLCLALFSYLSATGSPETRPFFPILCLFVALNIFLASWKHRYFFSSLHIFVWLSCMAVTFFFGLWPVGLIAITVSVLLSITLNLVSPHLAHLLISDAGTKQKNDESSAPPMQKSDQQEVQIPQPAYDTLVPGQQYQPLLPEYDSSYGPYIQDLPRE